LIPRSKKLGILRSAKALKDFLKDFSDWEKEQKRNFYQRERFWEAQGNQIKSNPANAKKNEYIPGERRKASDDEFPDA
jgi:hypothetical protein